MRICSFLPSTTEIIYGLGLGDSLTGVTHECDYPPEAREKKRVIMSFIDPEKLSSREIDELVSRNAAEGKSTYLIDKDALKRPTPISYLHRSSAKCARYRVTRSQRQWRRSGRIPRLYRSNRGR
ncbi:MAG: hypothetical protein L0213_11675 [Candidatus Dadabacteria bacterium]|nr:hypothetical protein [Candidatus Dadabacteria bacterium]